MSGRRVQRAKAKAVALKLQGDYRRLVEASGRDAIENASIELGGTFNTHIEFIINVLRDYGGLEAKFEPMTQTGAPPIPANDLPQTPAIFRAGCDVDMKKPH